MLGGRTAEESEDGKDIVIIGSQTPRYEQQRWRCAIPICGCIDIKMDQNQARSEPGRCVVSNPAFSNVLGRCAVAQESEKGTSVGTGNAAKHGNCG
jgi:hypothetical protein